MNELQRLAQDILRAIEEEDKYYELINNGGYRKNIKAKDVQQR